MIAARRQRPTNTPDITPMLQTGKRANMRGNVVQMPVPDGELLKARLGELNNRLAMVTMPRGELVKLLQVAMMTGLGAVADIAQRSVVARQHAQSARDRASAATTLFNVTSTKHEELARKYHAYWNHDGNRDGNGNRPNKTRQSQLAGNDGHKQVQVNPAVERNNEHVSDHGKVRQGHVSGPRPPE